MNPVHMRILESLKGKEKTMKPFKADISYFNGRYWAPTRHETIHASNWRVAGKRAFAKAMSNGLVSRMKPGDQISVILTSLKPVTFTEE